MAKCGLCGEYSSKYKISLIKHVRCEHLDDDGMMKYSLADAKAMVEEWLTGEAQVVAFKQPTYADPEEHRKAIKSAYYCEFSHVTGADETKKHSGEHVYAVGKDNYEETFVCDNHLPAAKAQGHKILKEHGGTPKFDNADVSKCMLHYGGQFICEMTKTRVPGKLHDVAVGKEALTGSDGTTTHWGETKKYALPSGAAFQFACTNHAPYWVARGYSVCVPTIKDCEHCGNAKATWRARNDGNGVTRRICSQCKGAYGAWHCVCLEAPPKRTTQKARGVDALWMQGFPMPSFEVYTAETVGGSPLSRFVRPCPVRPRHGFVESRKVKTAEEMQALVEETLRADAEAEFISMPFVNASHSGVWTPGTLTVGKGTSGATEGRETAVLPVLGDLTNIYGDGEALRKAAGIESAPYVELLWTKRGYTVSKMECDAVWQAVQLRDGPKLPNGKRDYVPKECEVRSVLLAEGDLLEWEEKIKRVEPGTVVYHPGGSLASHYAVHAVLNGVPILTTREPRAGEVLQPMGEEAAEVDVEAMRSGFMRGVKMEVRWKDAVLLMLCGCHNTVAWRGKQDYLLGVAMGLGWRLAYAEAVGEYRHYVERHLSREAVYVREWDRSFTKAAKEKFVECLRAFWLSQPASSIGGKKWYLFTVEAVKVHNALVEGDAKKALEALNKLANGVHNGGWGFNKFCSVSEMDKTARNPVYAAVLTAPSLYQLMTEPMEVAWETEVVETLEELVTKYRYETCDRCLNLGHIAELCPVAKKCTWCGEVGHDKAECEKWLKTQRPKPLTSPPPKVEVDVDAALAMLAGAGEPKLKPIATPKKVLEVKYAQATFRWDKPKPVHIQYTPSYMTGYGKKDVAVPAGKKTAIVKAWDAAKEHKKSLGGDAIYAVLTEGEDGWYLGEFKLLELEEA